MTNANTAAKTVFLSWVPEKLIHVNTAGDGRQFASVRFHCDKSANGFASVGASLNQLLPAIRKDTGVVDGYKHVLLGDPDRERIVSICAKAAKGSAKAEYKQVTMTNQEIADAVKTAAKAVFLNWVSEKLIYVKMTGNGREFARVKFPCDKSADGFAKVDLNMGQLLPATKDDKTVAGGYKNILLGRPDRERTVIICARAAKDGVQAKYKQVPMTNQAIADALAASRAAYRQARAAASVNA